jgi:internalin A
MKRARSLETLTLIFGLVALASIAGCDDQDKKKAELVTKTGASASAVVVASAVPKAAPAASSAPVAAKPPKDCGTGPDVTIDDPDIEAEIRLKLKKPKETSPGPLTSKDLAALTSLNVTKKATLEELDPCLFPKLVGLKFLYLPKGSYRDLKPIANLTKLEALRASISEVEDIKPLEKLVMLDQLDLGRSHVRDISTIANLVNLTELALDDTQVTDLTPLAKCTKLMTLSIKNTLVKDVSPLKDLKKLKTLNVQGTALENVDVLEPLKARGLKIQTK